MTPASKWAALEAAQRAKGLRKYGTTLEDAGLPVEALARHAAEECVDLCAYLRALAECDPDTIQAAALASWADEVREFAELLLLPLLEVSDV